MGTGLLAHRATTAGLPILVGAVLLLVAGAADAAQRCGARLARPARLIVAAAGTMGALLAPFHFFFLPAFPLHRARLGARGRPPHRRRRAAQCRLPARPVPAGAAVRDRDRHPGERLRIAPAGGDLAVRAARGRAHRGPRLLPHEPRRAVRPGARGAGRRPASRAGRSSPRGSSACSCVPNVDPGQHRRLRHEQVLPGDVDRRGDRRRVAHPPLAAAGDRGRAGAQRAVAAARGRRGRRRRTSRPSRAPTWSPRAGWPPTRRPTRCS